MAYLNEFPHFEANQLNLDWILEQYSTFNKRIKEIQDHFDEAVATIQGEVEELNNDFEEFKETVNSNFDTLSEELEGQVNEAITNIQSQINIINEHMETYVAEHMEEWQAEASYSNNILRLSDSASPLLDYSQSANSVQVGNKIHNFRLMPPQGMVKSNYSAIANDGTLTGVSPLSLEGVGCYLVIVKLNSKTALDNANSGYVGLSVTKEDTDITDLIPVKDRFSYSGENENFNLQSVGIYVNASTSAKHLTPKISYTNVSDLFDTGEVIMCAYKLNDTWNPTLY